jgi:glutathione S-transferase
VSDLIHHIAIQDDWEMSRAFGEYVVATRGVHLDDEGFIHATTVDRIDAVVAARFGDLTLPLLDIAISPEGLAAEGIAVEWVDGHPRILGALPMTSEVVASETPIAR